MVMKQMLMMLMTLMMVMCRMLMGMVDAIFSDVAQPDQARIVALNAHAFLKQGGHVIISIKVLSWTRHLH